MMYLYFPDMPHNWVTGSVPNILRDYIASIFKGQALECLAFEGEVTEMFVNIKSHLPNVTADHIP
jgi:hypothetical protein